MFFPDKSKVSAAGMEFLAVVLLNAKRFLLFALMLGSLNSHAQFETAIVAGITGRDLIARTDKLIQDSISNSREAGNAIVNKAASEASLLSRSIEISMTNQLNNSVRDLQDKLVREPFVRLAELADQIARGETRFYRMRDASVIDLQELASSSIFADSPIFLQRIDGIAYLQQSGEFKLGVTALGLRPTAGRNAVVKLLMDGVAVTPIRVETGATDSQNPGGTHTRSLVFNADIFANKFPVTKQVSMVPAIVDVTVTTKRLIFPEKVESIRVPIYISLIPRQIGELTVKTRSNAYGWVPQPAEKAAAHVDSRDCGENKCRYSFSMEIGVPFGETATPAPGHQRIISSRYVCEPRWGPYSCTYPGGWIDIAKSISPDKSRATLAIEHWAETNRYWFYVSYDEYLQTGVIEEEKKVPVVLGEQFSFTTPPNVISYQVVGKLINNLELNFTRGQSNDVLQSGIESDEPRNAKRVSFQISREALGL